MVNLSDWIKSDLVIALLYMELCLDIVEWWNGGTVEWNNSIVTLTILTTEYTKHTEKSFPIRKASSST